MTKAGKTKAPEAKTTATDKQYWWDDLPENERAKYVGGFSNPNYPTSAEINEAYDKAHTTGASGNPGTAGATVAEAVAAAHEVVANAKARKADADAKSAELAEGQRAKAADDQAADEAAKAEAGNPVIALPNIDPSVPLTKEEQDTIAKAREVIARPAPPDALPLTEEAQATLDEAEALPPASKTAPIPTPGASATNPALMRNDVDPEKTPPFGVGTSAHLQG